MTDQPVAVQRPKTGFNIQSLLSSIRGMSVMPRNFLGFLLGTASGTRDPYKTFGWDRQITSQSMWEMYNRGGIAKRIVHAYADATWGNPPELKSTQAFQKKWEELADDLKLWSILHRLDRLTNLGQYAILFIGTNQANLETPLRPGAEITFLQPYSDRSAQITAWGNDPTDPRFGLPTEYTIYPHKVAQEDRSINGGFSGGFGGTSVVNQQSSFRVHWSRVIHVTQGQLENDTFGIPILWSIWNYLTDLQKVVGGSAESYWLTANRGMSANVDKEVEMGPEDEAALSEELDEYHNGLRRFIRTRGVDIKSLGSEVANPEGPFKTIVTLIAGTTGIPQRIMLGSEAAHNASTQDKGNWAEHIQEYRLLTAGPHFLAPLIEKFMLIGVLPTVKLTKIEVSWPDAYRLSPLERAQMANQKATAANNLSLSAKNVTNLMSVEEMRKTLDMPEKMEGTTKPEVPEPPVPTAFGKPIKPKGPDGKTPKPGAGSGTTATPATDSNGQGKPVQTPK